MSFSFKNKCQNLDQHRLVVLCLLHSCSSAGHRLWDQEGREPTPHAYELADASDPQDFAQQALVRLALTIWDGEARVLDFAALSSEQFASVARLLVGFAKGDLDPWILEQLGEPVESA